MLHFFVYLMEIKLNISFMVKTGKEINFGFEASIVDERRHNFGLKKINFGLRLPS